MFRFDGLAGVDEVGRGPLAGAVYAAAVILDPLNPIVGLRDSKQLSEKKRMTLDVLIRERSVAWCIATASVAEIDDLNILHASLLAMQRAVTGLSVAPEFVLVDGNRSPGFAAPSGWMIKGDARNDCIKAASIVAKVARDQAMTELHAQYPAYGFAQHKGYPTKAHIEALNEVGPSPVHRMSFAPCRLAVRN